MTEQDMVSKGVAFGASTGRTATMFLARTLNDLPDVVALYEGHCPIESKTPQLPLINFHNRLAWHGPKFAMKVVEEMRSPSTMSSAKGDAGLVVDIAIFNAPLFGLFWKKQPTAKIFEIFRRCEAFVRSATIVDGEDPQPAGWAEGSACCPWQNSVAAPRKCRRTIVRKHGHLSS